MQSPRSDAGGLPSTPDIKLSPHLIPGLELSDEYPSLLSPSLSIYPELSIFDEDVVEPNADEAYSDGEPDNQAGYEEDDNLSYYDLVDDTLHDRRHFLGTIDETPEGVDAEGETLSVLEPQAEAEDESLLTQLVGHEEEIEAEPDSLFPHDASPPPQSPVGSFMSFSGSISSGSRIRIRSRPASVRFQTAATLTLREQEQASPHIIPSNLLTYFIPCGL